MKSKLSLSKTQRGGRKRKECVLSCKGWAELKSGGIRESLVAISEAGEGSWAPRAPADQHLRSPHPHLPLPMLGPCLGEHGGARTLQFFNFPHLLKTLEVLHFKLWLEQHGRII